MESFSNLTSAKGFVAFAALAAIMLIGCLPQPQQPDENIAIIEPMEAPYGTPTIQLEIHPDDARQTIPSDFLGLSYEANRLSSDHFSTNTAVFGQLFKNLGEGVLRLGGNGVEYTYWSPAAGKPATRVYAMLSPPDLDRLFNFASNIGWHVVLGLNLAANNPAMAADEAAYAAKIGKNSITAFEIGNEPDLYSRNGLRSQAYSYLNFSQEFAAYRNAILQKVPGAQIAGPFTAFNFDWFSSFVKDNSSNLALATHHHYPLSFDPLLSPDNWRYATVGRLLNTTTAKQTDGALERFKNAANANNLQLRIAETNWAYGNQFTTRNVFGVALWAADYLFRLAGQGMSGVNFQSGFPKDAYTPFYEDEDSKYHVQPLYYGMLLFHAAAKGRIVPIEMRSSLNIDAYAVADENILNVVLINKEVFQPVNVQITLDESFNDATALRLLAPSLWSQEEITFGGVGVDKNGKWTPRVKELVKQNAAGYQMVVPAASAVLVSFR